VVTPVFHIRADKVVINEVWVEDLRKAPDCLVYRGKKIPKTLAVQEIQKFFHSCQKPDHRYGGNLVPCENAQLTIGYGMGNFMQVRVSDGTWLATEAVNSAIGSSGK